VWTIFVTIFSFSESTRVPPWRAEILLADMVEWFGEKNYAMPSFAAAYDKRRLFVTGQLWHSRIKKMAPW